VLVRNNEHVDNDDDRWFAHYSIFARRRGCYYARIKDASTARPERKRFSNRQPTAVTRAAYTRFRFAGSSFVPSHSSVYVQPSWSRFRRRQDVNNIIAKHRERRGPWTSIWSRDPGAEQFLRKHAAWFVSKGRRNYVFRPFSGSVGRRASPHPTARNSTVWSYSVLERPSNPRDDLKIAIFSNNFLPGQSRTDFERARSLNSIL